MLIFISIILSFIFLIGNVSAENDVITGMKVPETEITMEIGDVYSFSPEFSTKGTSGDYNIELHIFSSDESVVTQVERIDPRELLGLSEDAYKEIISKTLNTIKAVGGGSATVILYSADYEFSHVCKVKVNGPAAGTKAKSAWNGPTAKQMKKVKDPALKAYLKMLDRQDMASAASGLAKKQSFKTLVTVTPGSQNKLAALFEKIGMEPVYAFSGINMVSVQGTAEQYLRVLEENNVLSIIEDVKDSVDAKDINHLEGGAEALTNIAKARKTGLTGAGTAVVILDTGINPKHEQFTGKKNSKIIMQACFSSRDTSRGIDYSCKNGKGKDLTSAEVGSQVSYPSDFNHGIHVAGIAAGKDGVAPEASIIAFNVFSEVLEFNNGSVKHDSTSYRSDQLRALDYLMEQFGSTVRTVKVDKKSYKVAALNFSLGGGAHSDTCNTDERTPYFKEFLKRGIIPVAASGNEYYDGYINAPACISSAFVVGALTDSSTPQVASFSNHSKLVNILAPGSYIYSSTTGTSNYQYMSGTSMATPMVTGAFALIRQRFPRLTGTQMKTMLTQMSSKTASRSSIKKKVLNFSKIATYKNLLVSAAKIYGGNKYLYITLPINKTYKPALKVKLYKCSKDRKDCKRISSPEVSITKGSKQTSIKIEELSNYAVYKVVVYGTVTYNSKTYNINTKTRYGMPMRIAIAKGSIYSNGIKINWKENSSYTKHEVRVYNMKNGKRTGSPISTVKISNSSYPTGYRLTGLRSGTSYYAAVRHISVVKGKTYYGRFTHVTFTTK